MPARAETDKLAYENWKRDVGVDVVAALIVDGWTDVQIKELVSGGKRTILAEGKQPKGGPIRPVIRYSKDVCRALHLARKAGRAADAEIVISVMPDLVSVEAYPLGDDLAEELFYAEADRTDLLALLLTQCSIKLAELSTPTGLAGRDLKQRG